MSDHTTEHDMKLYDDEGDLLLPSEIAADKVSLLPQDPAAEVEGRLRILWGQNMLRDMLEGRYRSVICSVMMKTTATAWSRNSSNSNRLVDVARAAGVASYLIDDETEIDATWLDGVKTVGVTSGASAPEKLVTRVCDWFRARGVERIEPFRMVNEDVTFRLPVELRRELALAETQR